MSHDIHDRRAIPFSYRFDCALKACFGFWIWCLSRFWLCKAKRWSFIKFLLFWLCVYIGGQFRCEVSVHFIKCKPIQSSCEERLEFEKGLSFDLCDTETVSSGSCKEKYSRISQSKMKNI